MVWLYLLPFLVLAQTATPFATLVPTPTLTLTPTPLPLTISNLPTQVTAGQQFSVTLNLHAKSSLSYQFKVYGGVSGDNYSYEVQNGGTWVNGYNGAWDSLPQSSTDASGNSSLELAIRFKTDKASGTSQLIAKVKESGANNYLVSSSYSIDVIDPSPTPISIPSSTNTPAPTNTNAPTSTPANTPTPTVTPTIIDTPSPTDIPEIVPSIEPGPTGSVLSASTSSESSEKSKSNFSLTNILPIIFIAAGGILLAVPLVITELKKIKID